MLRRALLRGRNSLKHPKGRWALIAKSLIAVPLYLISLPVTLLRGHHWFMKVSIKLCDHLGRILTLLGVNPSLSGRCMWNDAILSMQKITAENKSSRFRGSLVKTARLSAEGYEFVEDPSRIADEMKSLHVRADVLTLRTRFPLPSRASMFTASRKAWPSCRSRITKRGEAAD
jgi:hypothetical protein